MAANTSIQNCWHGCKPLGSSYNLYDQSALLPETSLPQYNTGCRNLKFTTLSGNSELHHKGSIIKHKKANQKNRVHTNNNNKQYFNNNVK